MHITKYIQYCSFQIYISSEWMIGNFRKICCTDCELLDGSNGPFLPLTIATSTAFLYMILIFINTRNVDLDIRGHYLYPFGKPEFLPEHSLRFLNQVFYTFSSGSVVTTTLTIRFAYLTELLHQLAVSLCVAPLPLLGPSCLFIEAFQLFW